jgi:H+-translocating NAD(P) transhydrogenase subunit alpha
MSIVTELAILVLAAFVGFEVISKVPNTLHTPLMSGTNAIHGIVVLGGVLLMHEASGLLEHVLLVIAITFGTINVVGGFLVTDRMLGMFKKKPEPVAAGAVEAPKADSIGSSGGAALPAGSAGAQLPAAADRTAADPGAADAAGSADSAATDATGSDPASPQAGGR